LKKTPVARLKAPAAGILKRIAPLSGYLKDYLFGGLIEL
jgi:hypothetical protein